MYEGLGDWAIGNRQVGGSRRTGPTRLSRRETRRSGWREYRPYAEPIDELHRGEWLWVEEKNQRAVSTRTMVARSSLPGA